MRSEYDLVGLRPVRSKITKICLGGGVSGREIGTNDAKQKESLLESPVMRKYGAGDGIRTHDFLLGKQTLYH